MLSFHGRPDANKGVCITMLPVKSMQNEVTTDTFKLSKMQLILQHTGA